MACIVFVALFCGVGLKDGRIVDGSISASSVYRTSENFLAHYGRLDRVNSGSERGGWLAHNGCCKLTLNYGNAFFSEVMINVKFKINVSALPSLRTCSQFLEKQLN